MKVNFSFIIFLSLFLLGYSFAFSQNDANISLTKEIKWQFRKQGDKEWIPATVPGTVHTDLFNNKKIPDPFFGSNEKEIQWIENENWEYQATFKIDAEILKNPHIRLVFEGLDTYAKVYLNDSIIITANNMFRIWKKDVKKYLKQGNNRLYILFESAVNKGKEMAKQLNYTLPGDEKVFVRKAQYQFGWDWGPRFVTCGIWRPVYIEVWKDFKIENIRLIQTSVTTEAANITAKLDILSDSANSFNIVAKSREMGVTLAISQVRFDKGMNTHKISFSIMKPELWWCNGLGNPKLYDFVFEIKKGKKVFDRKSVRTGLRSLELVRINDSAGKTFYFKLNGLPVYMKGANYIPPDNFMPRVSKDTYEKLTDDVVNSNMNMLRVWGGGIYESDDFYNICDEKGILVWQDFMFACAMYPGDDDFIENVKNEVTDNIKRLQFHPCIALWCGNNEIDEGWKNWGWQKQYKYSAKDSLKIWKDYVSLFQKIIPEIINKYDNMRPYWQSSPSIGWGHKESLLSGDSHYWGVWWGLEPFDTYKKKVGRFASEFGFQGLPDMKTIKEFCYSNNTVDSALLKNHEKHPTGFETIRKYMEREYNIPKNFEKYNYVSQLLQAYGIKTAIEAQRRNKPFCMGSLYWQLNDCWPVVSWSGRDYYGRWKALQYFVKNVYRDILITVDEKNERLRVYITSDRLAKAGGTLKLQLNDLSGKRLWKKDTAIIVKENSSAKYYDVCITDVLRNANLSNQVYFKAQFVSQNTDVYDNIFYFELPKNLILKKPEVKLSINADGPGNYIIKLRSGFLAKNIHLFLEKTDAIFSNNYFDLLPDEDVIIKCNTTISIEDLKAQLRYESLFDAIE
jgi:beta-mannosidase